MIALDAPQTPARSAGLLQGIGCLQHGSVDPPSALERLLQLPPGTIGVRIEVGRLSKFGDVVLDPKTIDRRRLAETSDPMRCR